MPLISGRCDRSSKVDRAFAPYGEVYNTFGSTTNTIFTGDYQDLVAGLFDTPNRELNQNQGRWISPDPSHSGWNAYAYSTNPLGTTDLSGLDDQAPDDFSFSTCGGAECAPTGFMNGELGLMGQPDWPLEALPPSDAGNINLTPWGTTNPLQALVDFGIEAALDTMVHNFTQGCAGGELCLGAVSPTGGLRGLQDLSFEGSVTGVATPSLTLRGSPETYFGGSTVKQLAYSERPVTLNHGSLNNLGRIAERGFDVNLDKMPVYVTRDIKAAAQAAFRVDWASNAANRGVVQSTMPQYVFDFAFASSEREYPGFFPYLDNVTEIPLRTPK